MTFYGLVLFAHSLVRWLILLLALLVCVRSFVAWWRGRAWRAMDERLHAALLGAVDAQFLIGLLLYIFLSPLPRAFWTNLGAAMKEPILRFYGLEHILMMIIVAAVLHIWRKRSMAAATDTLRHRRVWTSVLVGLAIMAVAIPWPERMYGRPLLRSPW